ncbi:MAG TPA: hypothetical protein VFW80_09285, partial [Gaiellaceae bacterium]|nr:hypothetical protein [Gaiellaceae bacterium]
MLMLVLICALAGLLLAVSLTAVLAVRKARTETDERVAEAVASLAAGMQETMRELATSVAGDVPARPEVPTAELASSLDLDEVTERTLDAAGQVRGVEAAFVDAG